MNTKTPLSAIGSARMLVLSGFAAIGALAYAQNAPAPAPVHWTKLSVSLPIDNPVFPPGDGALIATENCLICHSAGMVLRQPPLSQAEWLAEIRKMRAFFGAPMPADKDVALAQYLARINGPATGQAAPSKNATRK